MVDLNVNPLFLLLITACIINVIAQNDNSKVIKKL